jgi:hypothetical protein
MNIHTWAARWNLPIECVRDLQLTLGIYTPPLPDDAPGVGKSEAWVQSVVRIEASRKGLHLFRNNVGALKDERGRMVRYGLANDTKQMNEALKSADLIGWRRVLIAPQHVGHIFAQFTSREIKEPGWQYTGKDREAAQLAWANMVNSHGGDAAFATGEGTL